jgi:hypothetical protein
MFCCFRSASYSTQRLDLARINNFGTPIIYNIFHEKVENSLKILTNFLM